MSFEVERTRVSRREEETYDQKSKAVVNVLERAP